MSSVNFVLVVLCAALLLDTARGIEELSSNPPQTKLKYNPAYCTTLAKSDAVSDFSLSVRDVLSPGEKTSAINLYEYNIPNARITGYTITVCDDEGTAPPIVTELFEIFFYIERESKLNTYATVETNIYYRNLLQ